MKRSGLRLPGLATHRPGVTPLAATVLASLVLLGARDLAAQVQPVRPERGRFEVPGLDFRPDGAWRRRAARIRQSRRTLLRNGKLAALNQTGPSAVRVSGRFLIPVLPVAFSNVAAPFPAASYQATLFAPAPEGRPYSIRSYYAEMSRGLVTIDGVVRDWVVADSTDLYYEDNCNGIFFCPHGGQRLDELLLEALARNDDGVLDWGQFDNDGPDGIPNSGDDDGVVDFVMFLQPEVDGACGTSNLWSHRYTLRGLNGGSPYVTRSPRRDANGQPIAGQFITVDDYTLQSAVGGSDACTGGVIMAIGTPAHETGHAFGLPDLYDTNLQSPVASQGIGEWGIMGSGNYSIPFSPSAFEAWSLVELGWVTVDTLGADARVSLGPVAETDTVLYRGVPNTDEYFLFENRQALGSDSAQMNPACSTGHTSCAKGPGLLIWHIDQGQIDAHGFNRDNRVNSGPLHGVALEQADGLNQLRAAGSNNRGDGGDPYPGTTGNTRFGLSTMPAAVDNQGAGVGFELDSIAAAGPGGAVFFRFTNTVAGVVAVGLSQAANQLMGRATLGSAQLDYLDSLGNRNGSYDVGDFLALERSGAAATRPAATRSGLSARRARRAISSVPARPVPSPAGAPP